MSAKENPDALAGATGARNAFQATAGGIQKIARTGGNGTPYRVTPSAGVPFYIIVKGRDRWALEELLKAGARGCTPIDNPAPRWSAYVFNLRELGVEIDTITEPHEGEFPGHHARYVLRSGVSLGWKGGTA
jgi:hypothetical protein